MYRGQNTEALQVADSKENVDKINSKTPSYSKHSKSSLEREASNSKISKISTEKEPTVSRISKSSYERQIFFICKMRNHK